MTRSCTFCIYRAFNPGDHFDKRAFDMCAFPYTPKGALHVGCREARKDEGLCGAGAKHYEPDYIAQARERLKG